MIQRLDDLTDIISSLPGIGKKTALRLSFFLLRQPDNYIVNLINTLREFHSGVSFCNVCGALHDIEKDCYFCSAERDQSTICVVEQPMDALSIDRSGEYKGLFHILMGCLSPLDGIGPEDIRLSELFARIKSHNNLKEMIIATNPSLEGNATANYIAETCKDLPYLKITRIATGLALGSQIEYSDTEAIMQSIRTRVQISQKVQL